ncbi:MAG: hypothetical protein JWO03_3727 [Bacteroidetes bacterium]|nr:hypothetical protein [Bacteroidota bacterium]
MKKSVLIKILSSDNAVAVTVQKSLDPSSYNHDTRFVVLKAYSDITISHLIQQDLLDNNPISETRNYGLETPGSILKIAKEAIPAFTDNIDVDLRSSFFTSSTVCFETGLRSIGSSIGLTDEQILRLTSNILSKTKLHPDYLNLFKIISYSRNAMHNGGIITDITTPITYKGKTYDLQPGALKLFDEDFEFLFTEFISFWEDLCRCPLISVIPFIEHPYITEKSKGNI